MVWSPPRPANGWRNFERFSRALDGPDPARLTRAPGRCALERPDGELDRARPRRAIGTRRGLDRAPSRCDLSRSRSPRAHRTKGPTSRRGAFVVLRAGPAATQSRPKRPQTASPRALERPPTSGRECPSLLGIRAVRGHASFSPTRFRRPTLYPAELRALSQGGGSIVAPESRNHRAVEAAQEWLNHHRVPSPQRKKLGPRRGQLPRPCPDEQRPHDRRHLLA